MKGLNSETCLIPTSEGESRPVADSFGFITECFFLTHRALDLGYRLILDKFSKYEKDFMNDFLNVLMTLKQLRQLRYTCRARLILQDESRFN